MDKSTKSNKTISGKDFKSVREELLKKTMYLLEKRGKKFRELSEKIGLLSSKKLLKELADMEDEDRKNIEEILKTGSDLKNLPTADFSYSMFDHLIPRDIEEIDVSNLGNLLMTAMKSSKDLYNVFNIISKEYEDLKIMNIFSTLSAHELYKKNQLEILYDELIIKGEW